MDAIILIENPGHHVQIKLENTEPEHIMEYSITLKIIPGDRVQNELINQINQIYPTTNWTDIKFLTLVFLVQKAPTNLPDPLLRLYSLEPDEEVLGNGIVVTMNPDMNILHKPKRTKGKVSNTLG